MNFGKFKNAEWRKSLSYQVKQGWVPRQTAVGHQASDLPMLGISSVTCEMEKMTGLTSQAHSWWGLDKRMDLKDDPATHLIVPTAVDILLSDP